MTAKELIEQAQVVVSGDRQRDYGHPRDNHGCTAIMWSAWLSRKYDMPIEIDAQDVCFMNVLQKVSREANASKSDNSVDIVGYVLNAAMCKPAELEMVSPVLPPSLGFQMTACVCHNPDGDTSDK